MSEEEIADLERTLRVTKYPNEIVWIGSDDQIKKVTSIQNVEGEPSRCAMFESGDYAALYNTEMNDFALFTRLI